MVLDSINKHACVELSCRLSVASTSIAIDWKVAALPLSASSSQEAIASFTRLSPSVHRQTHQQM